MPYPTTPVAHLDIFYFRAGAFWNAAHHGPAVEHDPDQTETVPYSCDGLLGPDVRQDPRGPPHRRHRQKLSRPRAAGVQVALTFKLASNNSI